MANSNLTPAPHPPDDELSSLLEDALRCDPPDEAFVATLGAELEDQLQEVLAAKVLSFNSDDGTTCSQPDPGLVSTSRGGRPSVDVAHHRTRTRRTTRRSLLALCVAAVAVLAVSIWSSRPSYSWTSMLQALEGQPWIESAVVTASQDGEPPVRTWFSGSHRLVIVRSGDDVLWNDLQSRVQSRYVAGSDRLIRAPLAEGEPPSVEQTLLSLISSAETDTSQGGEVPSTDMRSVKVVSQSWRAIGAGANRRIELDVILQAEDGDSSSVHLLIQLDPNTQLPLSMQRIDQRANVNATVRFAFPDSGPNQLSDVGVPADVVVQDDASIDGQLARIAADAVDPLEEPHESKRTEVHRDGLLTRDRTAPGMADDAIVKSSDRIPPAAPDPPPTVSLSSDQMSRRIDELLSQRWQSAQVVPTGLSDDAEFHRRVYLDLIGRIPTVNECREFFDDPDTDRRHRLVESLLASRDHATHLGAVWRRFLLPDGVDLVPYGGSGSFEAWLSERFHPNVAYDQIIHELLLAEGRVGESGPLLFYAALNLKPEEIAAQTARAFLGVRLECAQCHDHRFDPRWKQTDFWSFAAFFARISRPEGKMETVSPVLRIADSEEGDVTLPETDVVVPPAFPLGGTAGDDTSRRAQLADWLTAPDNPHFARATVNRVWAHLFGRGLVEPVDDMRPDNPAVCPEVLDELAGYFVSTGYDLRDLFRVVVSSQVYQLTSQAAADDPDRTELFAQMNIKTLTAEQLYDSIAIATQLETLETSDGGLLEGSLVRVSNINRQVFLDQFRAPPGQATDYQSGIPQALTLMNGGLIQTATGLRSSGVLRALEAPFFTDQQRVDTLYLATLSRLPDDNERQTTLSYIQEAGADHSARLSDVLWALLNSAEFALNH